MDKTSLFAAAERVADWMVANQVTDRLDANKGRSVCVFDKTTDFYQMTTSWETGIMCMGLLAMYKRTGKPLYLDRAELAGRFIMSLQVMDQRQDRHYGVFREVSPQAIEFCPRDATTAAWALVWLYETVKNPEYLDRAILFGNWHLKHGMCNGWPLHGVFMDGQFTDHYAKGSFQSGTGLFYHDLFMMTGDSRYIEQGLRPIAETYRKDFFYRDGGLVMYREVFSNKDISAAMSEPSGHDMHKYNDDFGNAMLQAAADIFGDESFRETASKYALWLAAHQDLDGGFGNGGAPSGVPVALMYFNDLGGYYKNTELLAARDKTLAKLLAMQYQGTGDQRLDGGFQGTMHNFDAAAREKGAGGTSVDMRTSAYALNALLRLESNLENVWLGRNNAKFSDPLFSINEKPYLFKW
jgi:hypothetical protein